MSKIALRGVLPQAYNENDFSTWKFAFPKGLADKQEGQKGPTMNSQQRALSGAANPGYEIKTKGLPDLSEMTDEDLAKFKMNVQFVSIKAFFKAIQIIKNEEDKVFFEAGYFSINSIREGDKTISLHSSSRLTPAVHFEIKLKKQQGASPVILISIKGIEYPVPVSIVDTGDESIILQILL